MKWRMDFIIVGYLGYFVKSIKSNSRSLSITLSTNVLTQRELGPSNLLTKQEDNAMPHTLPCVLRIPLIAIIALVLLWLALCYSTTKASQPTVVEVNATTVRALPQEAARTVGAYVPQQWMDAYNLLPHSPLPHSAQDRSTANFTTDAKTTATTFPTITLQPATGEMLHQLFVSPAELQSAAIGPEIVVTKTVGLAPECATKNQLIITSTMQVVYCYVVVNTGDITLTHHTFVDDKIGTLAVGYSYELPPFGTLASGAYFTLPVIIDKTVRNTLSWTATTPTEDIMATSTAEALVVIPTLSLTTTVGTDMGSCGKQHTLSTFPDTAISICYKVKNTSPIPLPLHTLEDSSTGFLFQDELAPLAPGENRSIQRSTIATETITSMITWTGKAKNGVPTQAVDSVTIQVPSIQLHATVGANTTECADKKSVTVSYATPITICYLVTNTGGHLLNRHTITDSYYIYPPLDYSLLPGASFGVTVTIPATSSQIVESNWEARGISNLLAIADDTITIVVTTSTNVALHVFYDVDARGTINDMEPGVANVEVILQSPTARIYTATTDSQGIAHFAGLPEVGTFVTSVVTETLPANYEQTTKQARIEVARDSEMTKYLGFASPPGTDSDSDLIPDRIEGSYDFDNDGTPNYLDIDADGDGYSDRAEGTEDIDGDGFPNYLDPDLYIFLPMISQ